MGNLNATSSIEGLSVLTISQVQRSDSGLVVICNALNAVGSISARAKLSISSQDDRPPPIIIRGPVNQTLPVKSVAVLSKRFLFYHDFCFSSFDSNVLKKGNNQFYRFSFQFFPNRLCCDGRANTNYFMVSRWNSNGCLKSYQFN